VVSVFLVFKIFDTREMYSSDHKVTCASRESAVHWCEKEEGRKLNWIPATSKNNQTAYIPGNYSYEIEESEVIE
jgi:hypothetical protein